MKRRAPQSIFSPIVLFVERSERSVGSLIGSSRFDDGRFYSLREALERLVVKELEISLFRFRRKELALALEQVLP